MSEDAELPADTPLEEWDATLIGRLLDKHSADQEIIDTAAQVAYEFRLSSANDGSGWDRYECGSASLDIEDGGGCLGFGKVGFELDLGDIASLLDLRTLLNDPRVLARLEAIYNADGEESSEYSPWDDILSA